MIKRKLMILAIVLISFSAILASLAEDAFFISRLHEDGYFDLALSEISRIEGRLVNDRYSHQILIIKADILIRQGRLSEAQPILNRLGAMTLTPAQRSQVLFSLASIQRAMGDYEEAHTTVSNLISRFPDNDRMAEAKQLLADIYLAQNDTDSALAIFVELHISEPSETTFQNLIRLNLQLNNTVRAVEFTEQLIEKFPRAHIAHQMSLLQILEVYENRGAFQRMIDIIPESFETETVHTEPIYMRKLVANISLRNFSEAERILPNIRRDQESHNYYRALLHFERGEYHLALPIFRLLVNSEVESIRTMSFFNKVQIIARTDTSEAYDQLLEFLIANPDQPWEGDVLYQLGFIEFTNGNYFEALQYIRRALSFNLNDVNFRNALFLQGEAQFLIGDHFNSFITFYENLDNMPATLIDEAIFKIALNSFLMGFPDRATEFFHKLIAEQPSSQKLGLSYYYLGEINIMRNLEQARSYFTQALAGDIENGLIYLRLAYVDYLRRHFTSALNLLDQVPDTPEFMFDKHLLRGNILFTQRNLPAALEAYRVAEANARDMVSVELIWARQALLHYHMGNFEAAMAIFRRLADQSDTPGRFILAAAGAAFNANQFDQARNLYLEYTESFPNSPEFIRARLGLANSYFNLALYSSAVEVWKTLVNERQTPAVLEAALKGLNDSYQMLNRPALFTEFLHLAIIGSRDRDFRVNLFIYKATFEHELGDQRASIGTINQMLRSYPEMQENLPLMILLANNHAMTGNLSEADQIYYDLSRRHNDPLIFYEWGHIRWGQADYEAALIRFKRAADNSREEQYWITLLEKLVLRDDAAFIQYFEEFETFASPIHRDFATMHKIDWFILRGDFTSARGLVEGLVNHTQPGMRARAIFKLGEINFRQNMFSDAQANFLRIRYIFSDFTDLRWEAEYYLVRINVALGQTARANTLFASIRENLSATQIAELEALLR
jgi:tetratricopeptide (TPR) repeat protein